MPEKSSLELMTPIEVQSQWMQVTKKAMGLIPKEPSLREALKKFSKEPVSEQIPGEFLEILKKSDLFSGQLNQLAELEKFLAADSTRAELQRLILGRWTSHHTKEQAALFLGRSMFARDVKRLALMAELQDMPPEFGGNGEALLPSGIRIGIDIGRLDDIEDFLDPTLWEKRRQLKDRVHIITVKGKKYLLKERKSRSHSDQKKNGHVPPLTSAEEFEVARQFEASGPVRRGNTKIEWEKPLGYVEYPDGFSFVIFDYEEGFQEKGPTNYIEGIMAKEEVLQEDFKAVSKIAKDIWNNPEKYQLRFVSKMEGAENISKLIGKLKAKIGPEPQFDFRAYAQAKSSFSDRRDIHYVREAITERGYYNSDLDGFMTRVNDNPKHGILLEYLAFDFEYYTPIEKPEKSLEVERYHSFQFTMPSHGNTRNWINKPHQTVEQQLLLLAMIVMDFPDYDERMKTHIEDENKRLGKKFDLLDFPLNGL